MKKIDDNNFWIIPENPITKEGVFPYFGKNIDENLPADKIYYVLRPASEISNKEFLESLDGIPLQDEHEFIGDFGTRYDSRPAGGAVYNSIYKDGKVLSDMKIYSEKLKASILNGKKGLSMGYRCEYLPQKGVFNGKTYDFIQVSLKPNHIALVNSGRCGDDVRVFDKKDYKIVFDSIEINTQNIKGGSEMDAKIKKACDEMSRILKQHGVSDEDIKEAISKIEKETDEEVETLEKEVEVEVEDLDEKEVEVEVEKEKVIEDDDEDDDDKEDKKAMAAMEKSIMKRIASKNEFVSQLKSVIGAFASDSMTIEEVAKYAVKKLRLASDSGSEIATVKGYLQGKKINKEVKIASDETLIKNISIDKATARYLAS